MKIHALSRFLLASGLGALALYLTLVSGCSPAEPRDSAAVEAERAQRVASTYPIQTKLTNSEGKVISVTITGRTKSDVIIIPEGSREAVDYPITKLSKEDRRRVGALPEGTGPRPEDPYVVTRRKAIKDNERRIEEIRADIAGASISNTRSLIDAKTDKIKALEVENHQMEDQIKLYKK